MCDHLPHIIFHSVVCFEKFEVKNGKYCMERIILYFFSSGYLKTPIGLENEGFLSEMLFDTWINLLNAGPGSTHLHMLNIILKTPDDLLWKYLEVIILTSNLLITPLR